MDYCYACRRHLNGAYSCPGCGTPADRLTLPAVTETATLPPVSGDEQELFGSGRAARRHEGRRSAARRARRGRQRVAVYGVGAIAVVGALAMFSMAALSGGSGGGADPGVGVNPVLPGAPSDGPSPDDAGLVPSAPGGAPGHHATATPKGSAKPTSASPSPSTTAPHTSAPATTAPHTSAPPTTTPTPTPTRTQPTATPTPTPTRCKKVLWWCQ